MGIVAIETALLTLIRAYASGSVFNAKNSSIDDAIVLDAPGTLWAAIVSMASDATEGDNLDGRARYGKYQEIYDLSLLIARKRASGADGDGGATAALMALVDDLKAYLRQYPRLNNTAGLGRVQIVRTTRPSPIVPAGAAAGTPGTHVAAQIILHVETDITIVEVETAR